MRGFAEFRGSYHSAVNFLSIGFCATVTDASRSSDFVICGAASRADQVLTDRAQDSSIRSVRALASASAARTSKLHVCVQRAAGFMQTQNLISNGYALFPLILMKTVDLFCEYSVTVCIEIEPAYASGICDSKKSMSLSPIIVLEQIFASS